MYYTQAHVITDLWIRSDGPIPARIAAMDERAVQFFTVWRTHTWENVRPPPTPPHPTLLSHSFPMLIPSTQRDAPLDNMTEEDVVKRFAKEGRILVPRLKPAVSDFDEYRLVFRRVTISGRRSSSSTRLGTSHLVLEALGFGASSGAGTTRMVEHFFHFFHDTTS